MGLGVGSDAVRKPVSKSPVRSSSVTGPMLSTPGLRKAAMAFVIAVVVLVSGSGFGLFMATDAMADPGGSVPRSSAAECELKYSAGPNGSISGDASQTVAVGESGSAVTAVADAGYRFHMWSDGSRQNPRTDIGTQDDATFTAWFTLEPQSVVVWGTSEHGLVDDVPDGTDLVAVAAGWAHCVALKSDGSLVAWGHSSNKKTVPPAGDDFVAIAAGRDHSLALKADGSVVTWGRDNYGQVAPPPGDNVDFVAIATGNYFNMARKSDGTVVLWGRDDHGQSTLPDELQGVPIADMGGGSRYSIVLLEDGGSLYTWGLDTAKRLDHPRDKGFRAIAAGGSHGIALHADGGIHMWGNNNNAQSEPIAGLNAGFIGIAGGWRHSLALRDDGTVLAWGYGKEGQAVSPLGDGFTAISSGRSHNVALKSDPGCTVEADVAGTGGGDVSGSGGYRFGEMATVEAEPAAGHHFVEWTEGVDGPAVSTSAIYQFQVVGDRNLVAHFAEGRTPYGLRYTTGVGGSIQGDGRQIVLQGDDGKAVTAVPDSGYYFYKWSDGKTEPTRKDIGVTADIDVTAWFFHTPGSLVTWGDSQQGLGDVPSGDDFVAISAGTMHSLALRSDGSIEAWGSNDRLQLEKPSDDRWVAVSAGRYGGMALRDDRSLYVWGDVSSIEDEVPEGDDFIAISFGSTHCAALKADGSVVSWGNNVHGQGVTGAPSGDDFVAIDAGYWQNLALRSDGSLATWGRNNFGQGDPPADNSDIVAASGGGRHNLALKRDGSIIAWGRNNEGQTTVPADNSGFIAVAGGGNGIDSGSDFSLALKGDGSIVAWGGRLTRAVHRRPH